MFCIQKYDLPGGGNLSFFCSSGYKRTCFPRIAEDRIPVYRLWTSDVESLHAAGLPADQNGNCIPSPSKKHTAGPANGKNETVPRALHRVETSSLAMSCLFLFIRFGRTQPGMYGIPDENCFRLWGQPFVCFQSDFLPSASWVPSLYPSDTVGEVRKPWDNRKQVRFDGTGQPSYRQNQEKSSADFPAGRADTLPLVTCDTPRN